MLHEKKKKNQGRLFAASVHERFYGLKTKKRKILGIYPSKKKDSRLPKMCQVYHTAIDAAFNP